MRIVFLGFEDRHFSRVNLGHVSKISLIIEMLYKDFALFSPVAMKGLSKKIRYLKGNLFYVPFVSDLCAFLQVVDLFLLTQPREIRPLKPSPLPKMIQVLCKRPAH